MHYRRGHGEGTGTFALDDKDAAVACGRAEPGGVGIGGIVDQCCQRGGHRLRGVGGAGGVAHARLGRADAELKAEVVAWAYGAADGRTGGRRRHPNLGQRAGRRHGEARVEERTGAIDDDQLRSLGHGAEVGRPLRVDRIGQVARDLA